MTSDRKSPTMARFSSLLAMALALSPIGCGQDASGPAAVSAGGAPEGGSGTGGSEPGGGTAPIGGTATGGSTGGAPTATGGTTGGVMTATGGDPSGGDSSGGSSEGGLAGTDAGGNSGESGGGSAGDDPIGGSGGGEQAGGGSGGTSSGGGPGTKAPNDVCPRGSSAKALSLSGSLGAHDPALIFADNQYYLFATGLAAKTSQNLTAWQGASSPFSIPSWVRSTISGANNLWAPDISYFGGTYHLYYAASTFGSNHSCIGHATRDSMSSGSWTDHGSVICSNDGTNDNWNAIDANVIIDENDDIWMVFGSFWGGLKMIQLDASGERMGTELISVAARPQNGGALEAPFILRQCGYYYLFTSWDHCCDNPYNYNIRVGRSTSVTGPYLDKDGKDLMQGGGTLLVEGNSSWQGPGHNAVIVTENAAYNVYHALNPSNHGSSLRVAELVFDDQDWPVSGGP